MTNNAKNVVISKGLGPYENTKKVLAHFDFSHLKGKKVLLKPNAGRVAQPEKGITTHPQVVAAAIDFFREFASTVAIGESPISGVKTMEAFEETGIASVARDRNCPLLDLDKNKPVITEIPKSITVKSLKICKEIFEFDYIVSIPVIKTHMHTGITLAIKNMKGCLWRRSKVLFHMLPEIKGCKEKPIDVAIAEMSTVLKPHFSIIDGTICMEGMGPSAGNPRPIDTVIAGENPFMVDAVTCALIGIDPASIPHIRMGAALNKTTIDLDKIDILPRNWKNYIVAFETSPSSFSIQYPNIIVHDRNSCSACQSSLFLFLKQYGKKLLDYFPVENINIAIGKGNSNLPEKTICIGNCTLNSKTKGIYIQGCPPVSSEILRSITGSEEFDTADGHGQRPIEK